MIHTAFADLQPPHARKLIQRWRGKDRAAAEKIRQELAGKRWQDMGSDFVRQRLSSFVYLTPEAYRYYLPALLIAALEAFETGDMLLHSVLFDLCPSFWCLYYEGEDQDFAAKQAAFAPEEYQAVCAFLGLAFEQAPRYRHLAAHALHWGWNRLPTPALEAANHYYHRLHTFTFQEPAEPEIAALCREIQSAFAATPYPGDDNLCGSDKGDEPAECAVELRGLKWQSVHPELLARNYTALSFLSDTGFRYFLPAFLLSDLSGYESNAEPMFHLTSGLYDPGLDELDEVGLSVLERLMTPEQQELYHQAQERSRATDWREYSMRRLLPFDKGERLAIIRYLEYRKDAYNTERINQALEGYWRPSVQ